VPDPNDPALTVASPARDPHASGGSIGGQTNAASSPPGQVAFDFGPPAAPGEAGVLGPYRVVKELGRGGMGAVYLALDTRLDRKLALKVMLPESAANPEAKERFLREARATAKITHDNVVTVYEADERQGVPYIAMQFLQGYPLDDFLKKKGTPAMRHIIRIAREAALGLAAAHKFGLVHRDIKPANLWLEAPNARVKVLDFGLAKPVGADTELTKSGAVVGTPAFMSPEQARAEKVDHRTDLFSLGAVMYRLTTGQQPFPGATVLAVLMALGMEDPKPVRELNPHVPESLARLIHRLLAKNPGDRPQTAADVAKQLLAIQEQLGTLPAGAAEAPAEGGPWPTRGRAKNPPKAEISRSQPVVVDSVPVQPPLVSRMEVSATPEPVIAKLGAGGSGEATEVERAAPSRKGKPKSKPEGKKPRGGWVWLAGGVAAAVAVASVVAVAAVILATSGKPREPAPEVKEPAPVPAPPLAPVPNPSNSVEQGGPTPAPADAERAAAEYAISVGGSVLIQDQDGGTREVKKSRELPEGPFRLRGILFFGAGKLTDEGMAAFRPCRQLRRVVIVCSNLTDDGLAHLRDCKELTELTLSGAEYTDAGLAHFAGLRDLTSLSLTAAPGCNSPSYTDGGLAVFKDCKKLQILSLSGGSVTDAGLANFTDCRKLKTIDLNGTGVTDEALSLLKDFPSLAHLKVQKTRVTAKGVEQFALAAPGCRVEWGTPKK
jgi:serine/threonine protein kinase